MKKELVVCHKCGETLNKNKVICTNCHHINFKSNCGVLLIIITLVIFLSIIIQDIKSVSEINEENVNRLYDKIYNTTDDKYDYNKSSKNEEDNNDSNYNEDEENNQKNDSSKAENSNKDKQTNTDKNIESKSDDKQSNSSNDNSTNEEQNKIDSPNVDVSKQNALRVAKSYLNIGGFSKNGLIKQLEYEEFALDEVTYAVDNCGANWNEQAFKMAKSYLEISGFSRDGLIEQLEFEGFTHEQAIYGVTQNGL